MVWMENDKITARLKRVEAGSFRKCCNEHYTLTFCDNLLLGFSSQFQLIVLKYIDSGVFLKQLKIPYYLADKDRLY